jgi:RNA polymerase sigma-70 factor (ECF subfamily)
VRFQAALKPDPPIAPSNPVVDTAPDEHAWVARARAGDPEAFRKLVERHRDRAYALAFRMLGSASDAEEAAQDAFLRAWRALPQFRGECAFSTWLHRIVVRRALDRRAALKSRRARESPLEEAADAVAPEAPDAGPRRRLDRLLDRLSEVQRTVVLLYYYEDRSVEEVSRILEIPDGSVKTHLHRARAQLREAWTEEER